MSGIFDFLTGLLNPAANAAAAGGMPQPGASPGFFGGLQQGFNNFGKQLNGMFGQNQAPGVPQYYKDANPQASLTEASLKTSGLQPTAESLGMVNDPSNPMNNDMMRKMMLAQFLARQGQQQQPGAGGMPPAAPPMMAGGGRPGGMMQPGGVGAGMMGINKYNLPPVMRKPFIGSGGY